MPELPEVEVVKRGLSPLLKGRRVHAVHHTVSSLRYVLPDMGALAGLVCEDISRRAKYLLFHFDKDMVLVWHLGMTGQLHVLADNTPGARHEHVRIDFTGGKSLRYRDVRKFGYVGLMCATAWQRHPWFSRLGPEPLSGTFDGVYLHARCAGRKAPIKHVLMDAHTVAGIGNIYAAEALFRAGIHPARPACRISAKRLHALTAHVKAVLHEAIMAGGSTIDDFVQVDGRPGYFAFSLEVYGRAGKACMRCGGVIRRIVLAGRGTFYCPGCQH